MSQTQRGYGGGQYASHAPQNASPSINLTKIVFGDIQPTLYSDIAEEAAKTVAGENRKSPKNKPSQLRRFYDELVMLQDKVGSNQQHFDQQHPFIQMLKAKVAYALGREKVDENFQALLRHVVDQAKDPAALKQARLFMEAFMAFYKVYRPAD
jgi:CRISPR-associated protein Csm2